MELGTKYTEDRVIKSNVEKCTYPHGIYVGYDEVTEELIILTAHKELDGFELKSRIKNNIRVVNEPKLELLKICEGSRGTTHYLGEFALLNDSYTSLLFTPTFKSEQTIYIKSNGNVKIVSSVVGAKDLDLPIQGYARLKRFLNITK